MVEFMARSIRNELVSKTRVGTQLYAQLEMSPVYVQIVMISEKYADIQSEVQLARNRQK